MGRVVRGMATAVLGVSSAMVAGRVGAIGRIGGALDVWRDVEEDAAGGGVDVGLA
jgi:hypothetical protein